MRPLRLSVALLLLLVSALALAAEQPKASSIQAAPSVQQMQRPVSSMPRPPTIWAVRWPSTVGVEGCLKMRSYIYAHENPRSDAMTLVGTTTCTPAWKFSYKTADVRRTSAPDQQPATDGDAPRRQSQERGGTPTAGAADHQQ